MRRTVLDFRKSRIPATLGSCAADLPRLCSYINEAQERLLLHGGKRGWWGTWQKMVFNVTRSGPYIVCPREVAKVTDISVCANSIPIYNQFYETLEVGIGPQPPNPCYQDCCDTTMGAFDRGIYPTMVDLPTTGGPYRIAVYPTDVRDVGKRVLVTGVDTNGVIVRNTDGTQEVTGEFVTMAMPYDLTVSGWSSLGGFQKDVTYRDIQVAAFDTITGSITVLSTFAPDETVPSYRRYYINNLPDNCCGTTGSTIQVTAMCKLEYMPVRSDTDFLLIGNLPALKEECEAVRYGEMDSPTAMQMAEVKHRNAIRLLNKELDSYQDLDNPSISMPLWGTAKLGEQSIGRLI